MLKIFRTLLGLMLIAVTMLAFTGCGGGSTASGTVFYLSHQDGDGFTDMIRKSFSDKAKAAGIPVEYRDAKGDVNMQIDQMKEAIAAKPSAIVLLAVDGTALVPMVEKANEAGIPIIITNRGLNGGKYLSCMVDEKQAGIMQGEYMAKHLPPNAKVVYLEGEKGFEGSVLRWQGFKEACLDKRSDVQLLASTSANWRTSDALRNVALWTKLFPQIDGVIAANDSMAVGAVQALKDAGRLDGCLISGVDAMDEALKLIDAGEMSQTVQQDANALADGTFKLVDSCLKGKIPTENIVVEFKSITKDNIAQFRK
ncbi:putative D-galactose-binding periplasmic protein [Selenomonas ruminantium subsp. lactilytica TAM6421]|uniref:Putative D-galactose-binding periplasmic protein n=1 Tax=Selenomonas ruminantium subsp. lactilytica (strain NBRC 103574 / TAM6421) TaxID=927704 RepID=I0GMY1_SELRL|nr:putative D-galactose-binding periplasmic protein [Selenomonas ruminantium subsp. lactilytica TAM6421]